MRSASSTSDADDVAAAVDALRRGGLVVFPTETVYGVGCDPRSEAALSRLFQVKGRPRERAVTVHLADAAEARAWAASLDENFERLASAFWPGAITLVVPARPDVPMAIRGGRSTVGLRVPDHPLARRVVHEFGAGIVGSSANRHGESAATTVDAARSVLGNVVDVYLDGGACPLGEGSTVLDLSVSPPVVLRLGALPPQDIAAELGTEVAVVAK